jgi:WD40 repeat protein
VLDKKSILGTVLIALSGLLGTVLGVVFQGYNNTELERQKFESQLIQKALETKDKTEAAKNLLFLVDSGVIQQLDGHKIKEMANSPEQLPVYSELLKVAGGGSLAVSPDGNSIIVGNIDGTATLWDVGTDKMIGSFNHGQGAVKSVAYAQNGKTVITAGEDKSVKVWNVASKQRVAGFQLSDSILAIGMSPDGKTVYIRGDDNKIRKWNLDEPKKTSMMDLNLNKH